MAPMYVSSTPYIMCLLKLSISACCIKPLLWRCIIDCVGVALVLHQRSTPVMSSATCDTNKVSEHLFDLWAFELKLAANPQKQSNHSEEMDDSTTPDAEMLQLRNLARDPRTVPMPVLSHSVPILDLPNPVSNPDLLPGPCRSCIEPRSIAVVPHHSPKHHWPGRYTSLNGLLSAAERRYAKFGTQAAEFEKPAAAQPGANPAAPSGAFPRLLGRTQTQRCQGRPAKQRPSEARC